MEMDQPININSNAQSETHCEFVTAIQNALTLIEPPWQHNARCYNGVTFALKALFALSILPINTNAAKYKHEQRARTHSKRVHFLNYCCCYSKEMLSQDLRHVRHTAESLCSLADLPTPRPVALAPAYTDGMVQYSSCCCARPNAKEVNECGKGVCPVDGAVHAIHTTEARK